MKQHTVTVRVESCVIYRACLCLRRSSTRLYLFCFLAWSLVHRRYLLRANRRHVILQKQHERFSVFAPPVVAQWRCGAVARWRGGAVARWRGGTVARWHGGAVARASDFRLTKPGFESGPAVLILGQVFSLYIAHVHSAEWRSTWL